MQGPRTGARSLNMRTPSAGSNRSMFSTGRFLRVRGNPSSLAVQPLQPLPLRLVALPLQPLGLDQICHLGAELREQPEALRQQAFGAVLGREPGRPPG